MRCISLKNFTKKFIVRYQDLKVIKSWYPDMFVNDKFLIHWYIHDDFLPAITNRMAPHPYKAWKIYHPIAVMYETTVI